MGFDDSRRYNSRFLSLFVGRDVKLRANYKQNWVRQSEKLVANFAWAKHQPRPAARDV